MNGSPDTNVVIVCIFEMAVIRYILIQPLPRLHLGLFWASSMTFSTLYPMCDCLSSELPARAEDIPNLLLLIAELRVSGAK